MMQTFEFEVLEKPLGDGTHSYEAKDKATGGLFPLPRGGNDDGKTNLVGAYPEIEAYLQSQYGVTAKLVFIPSFDEMHYRPGGATWTFWRNQRQLVVVIDDIHRPVFRFTVAWARS